MQALFNKSDEGNLDGLKLLNGEVIKFKFEDKKYKIPHMGWNTVTFKQESNFTCMASQN